MNLDAMTDDEKMDALDKIQASMRDGGSNMNLYAMSDDEKMAALDSIEESLRKSEEVQKQKIAENVDLVIQALKKIESDIQAKYDGVTTVIETRVANIRDGRDGKDGTDGRNGRDGLPGKDGLPGPRGLDGKDGVNGLDGLDGVSVIDAQIDFDGSLVITLSNGREINVGEVVPIDLAESIKVITNGGGTSQSVLDTLASLQAQIDSLGGGGITSVASADGSVTVTTVSGAVDLSVAIAASTTTVVIRVRNASGATLTKGTVVYISGATGQLPTVVKAIATGDTTSAQTLGVMTADLANNSNGYVTVIGGITNIDTSAFTDGQQLYLSGTTAGGLTATKPYAPIHLVYIAIVEYAHPTQGKLFIKVQNGYELDELHNVAAQTPSNGDTLVYNTTTSLWENSSTFSSNKVISVTDNTNAALRITQLGTGNALLVEDATNPDSTPFVIDATGRVIAGNTLAVSFTGGLLPQMEVLGNTNNTSAFGIGSFRADAGSGYATFLKSRSATVGTLGGAVISGDSLGTILWNGDDGTAGIQAASISASVDGTPGTNDMPGRLVFNTTADGAIAPTERMRIDSAGRVGIGGTPAAGENLHIAKTVTGSTTANAVINDGAVQSDVTSTARMFYTSPSTVATAFTLGSLVHYSANQGTKGTGSTITTQIGFHARNTLISGTTNYGFLTDIVAGDTTPGSINRWSFYSGTAPSYLGGDLLLNGKISLGTATTANYGTAGQVLTSSGDTTSPYWSTPANGATGKAIIMAMIFGL